MLGDVIVYTNCISVERVLVPPWHLSPVTINNCGDNAINYVVEVWLTQKAVAVSEYIVSIKLTHNVCHKI